MIERALETKGGATVLLGKYGRNHLESCLAEPALMARLLARSVEEATEAGFCSCSTAS